MRAADAEVASAEAQLQAARAAKQAIACSATDPGVRRRLRGASAMHSPRWLVPPSRAIKRRRAKARRALIRAIGEAYHPDDLARAEAQPPARLATRLAAPFPLLGVDQNCWPIVAQSRWPLTRPKPSA